MNIGLQIKIARVEKEWTQDQLRMNTGISAATIGNIEAGKGNPKLKTVQKLIKCLGYELRITKEANNEQNKESI